MAWNSKKGDTRTVTRFAFRPTTMSDGRRICLRFYRAEQIFEEGGFGLGEYKRWNTYRREQLLSGM